MSKKIKDLLYLFFFFTFIIYTIIFYFSEENMRAINKSRSSYSLNIMNNILNIPLLKNDTINIIEHNVDLEVKKKKKKKYKFWDLINK